MALRTGIVQKLRGAAGSAVFRASAVAAAFAWLAYVLITSRMP